MTMQTPTRLLDGHYWVGDERDAHAQLPDHQRRALKLDHLSTQAHTAVSITKETATSLQSQCKVGTLVDVFRSALVSTHIYKTQGRASRLI